MHTPPGRRGLRGISYNGLNVKAPPETVPFLRFQVSEVYQMVSEVYQMEFTS